MQQPLLIVFPFFVSVFIVRVLPRVILAPVALVMLLVLNRWFGPGTDGEVVDQRPQYAADRLASYPDTTSSGLPALTINEY